jgi:glycolate oxidase
MERLTPSMLEIMDRTTLTAVESWRPMGLDTTAEALLIAQSDAPGEAGRTEADILIEICERAGATEAYRSEDEEEAEMLLGARRMAIPALEAMGDWLLDDIAVPRTAFAQAVGLIEEAAKTHDVMIGTFGHAGDGNLHPTIVVPRGDEAAMERAFLAFDAILDIALSVGGTVTGEHGVGLLKRRHLAQELDPVAIDLHPQIKQALDPLGILNPGKSLPHW